MRRSLIILALMVACEASAQSAPPPDYDSQQAWAAYPGKASHALDRPATLPASRGGETAVFFIHPTTDLRMSVGNASIDPKADEQRRVDEIVLAAQASVFSDCCTVYAPRFRQATLGAVTRQGDAAFAAVDLAYRDVERAFETFLARIGERPFILASHSQGSIHALRLVQEVILPRHLDRRLIAGYLVGLALPLAIEDLGLPICRDALETRCILTWNSVRRGHDDRRRREDSLIWWEGRYQAIAGRPLACVNPLDWKPGSRALASANLGGVYHTRGALSAPVPGLTDAACANGLLEVHLELTERRHFSDTLTLIGVYHDFDYALFYMNLRDNAARRIAAYADGAHRLPTGKPMRSS